MKISKFAIFKKRFTSRWLGEDYPKGEPRFQISLFAKDVATFIGVPVIAIILYKSIENAAQTPRRHPQQVQASRNRSISDENKSQIIDFKGRTTTSALATDARRSPGALIKLRLLNSVETYSTAPVHAQVIDAGLGQSLLGGTFIGDATPDTKFERITMTFKYVRDPRRGNVAFSISARALSLDGTLGLNAGKKEGFVTRSVLGSAHSSVQDLPSKGASTSLAEILIKALSAGLIQELGSDTGVENNRAQVLTLRPGLEFFAELTDFFPGNSK